MINFRQQALEEQFNPRATEEYLKLTSPSVYMVMGIILLLAGALITWGIMGSVTDKVHMKGVIYPMDGIESVSLPNKGIMRQPLTSVGDQVRNGQTLAMVDINGQYSILSCPADGEIISMKEEQQPFEAFEPIITIQKNKKGETVHCLTAFADFKTQRKLELDQSVQVNPTFLTREKNGYIPGRIISISRYPVTQEEELRKMKLQHFGQNIFPDGNLAYEVQIELEMDKNDPKQFAWTFTQDKPVDMCTGTICNIQVITKRRSILKYLFESVMEKYSDVDESVTE